MLIKICGMTSKKDIDICSNNKVNIVGFLLEMPNFKRDDMLNIKIAKELISYVPKDITSCLLIHYKEIQKIISIIQELNPDMIQIQKQSNLSIDDLKEIKKIFPKIKTTKTFYLDEDTNFTILINKIQKYIDSNIIDYILLDSKIGGSGKTHNWELSSKIVQKLFPFPIILAGGLNPDNIKDAIDKVKPFGVDVMSGVNKDNSKCKDMKKISHFVKNINN